MSISRLSAIVAILVIGTALAVGAYVDAQRGSLPVTELGTPILEFGPSYPMPRPLRAPENRAPTARRPIVRSSEPVGLVRATRVEGESPSAVVAPFASVSELRVDRVPDPTAIALPATN
jgi:hypothetical protein